MNAQMLDLVQKMTGPAPIMRSFDDYVDFTLFLENFVENSEITNIQGWEIKKIDGRIRYFGDHHNDYEFVWRERKTFNDWLRTLNEAYQAWLNE